MAHRPFRLILVSCVGCGRLHAPEQALDLHPRCERCRGGANESTSGAPR
jgi:hypothetical protein